MFNSFEISKFDVKLASKVRNVGENRHLFKHLLDVLSLLSLTLPSEH